jgi:hypothetical protein
VGEEPQEQRESGPENKTGDEGKVECSVFTAVDDVAGEAAEAQGELAAKIEERAENDQEDAESEEHAAEFAERVHERDSKRNEAKK